MKGKTSVILIGIVLLLTVGGLIIMLSSLNRIVAAAIEKYGSQVTQTRVTVSAVDIKLKEKEGSLNGITISNPSGFSGPAAFHLGHVSTKIDTASLTGDRITIDNVTISGPHIMYEIDEAGRSNIDIIKKNIRQFQDKSAAGKTEVQKEGDEKSVKLHIRKLLIVNGKIDVRVAALSDKTFSADLPGIELSNVGGAGGASPGEVGAQILAALSRETAAAASGLGVEPYIGKTSDEVRKNLAKGGDILRETARGAGEAVKKLFGK